MRHSDVVAYCNFSKTQLHRLLKDGKFPQPHDRRHRFTVWLRSDVEQWMQNYIANPKSLPVFRRTDFADQAKALNPA